ncbi:MAG: 50S ribosomal protein L13 [Candidatus Omnitrophota bacterium]
MQIKRNKTYIAKKPDIKRTWYIVDAKDKILGRMATRIATVLRGKNKPNFSPHQDTGDGVIVINAKDVRLTGRKMQEKVYYRFSGYPGGQRQVSFEQMLEKKPQLIIEHAVRGMLPNTKLRKDILNRLKVYKDETHPHIGQKPVKLDI